MIDPRLRVKKHCSKMDGSIEMKDNIEEHNYNEEETEVQTVINVGKSAKNRTILILKMEKYELNNSVRFPNSVSVRFQIVSGGEGRLKQ